MKIIKKSQNIGQLVKALKAAEKRCTAMSAEAISIQKYYSGFMQSIFLQQEAEKRSISRELHDEIAQMLTGINFELAILSKEAANGTKELQEKIIHTQKLFEDSVGVVHNYARELRPLTLDDLGLKDALKSYIADFMKISNIIVKLHYDKNVPVLDDILNTVLFRVVQEALTNTHKHSHAAHSTITIKCVKKFIQMVIHNDGDSFNVKEALTSSNGRIGLRGMIERVKLANGTLVIISTEAKGTKITVCIPCSEK